MGCDAMILLDTHVWIWWVMQDDRLSQAWADRLDSIPQGEVVVSAISLWEVGMLHSLGRIRLETTLENWFAGAVGPDGAEVIGISTAVAAESSKLPMHGDLADRLIVATARVLGCKLMSYDQAIKDSGLVAIEER
jgi:PIN domain nuclease of toxin-antitoxin system